MACGDGAGGEDGCQAIRAIAARIVAASIFNRTTFLSAQRLHIEIEGHRSARRCAVSIAGDLY